MVAEPCIACTLRNGRHLVDRHPRLAHDLFDRLPFVSCSVTRYTIYVIISFRHKGLETLYRTGSTRGVQTAHASKLLRILSALDAAASPSELNHPGYRLHPLKGELKGHWSVWVNGNWRVTFRFAGTDTELVDYQDYH
jgi:proteic killer suppression protein